MLITSRSVIPAIIVLSLYGPITGCQSSAPNPILAKKSCAQLAVKDRSEEQAFAAKSDLHRLFLKKYGDEGVSISFKEREQGIKPPEGSVGQRLAYFAVKACTPRHGAAQCNAVAKDYAEYEDQANDRSWARRRLKCPPPPQ